MGSEEHQDTDALRGASFRRVDLSGASFREVDLTGATVRDSDVTGLRIGLVSNAGAGLPINGEGTSRGSRVSPMARNATRMPKTATAVISAASLGARRSRR